MLSLVLLFISRHTQRHLVNEGVYTTRIIHGLSAKPHKCLFGNQCNRIDSVDVPA